MRTIIEVPEDEIRSLDLVGQQQRKSRAAVIRDAIRLYLENKTIIDSDAAFGIWKGRESDGVSYQEQLRSEWS